MPPPITTTSNVTLSMSYSLAAEPKFNPHSSYQPYLLCQLENVLTGQIPDRPICQGRRIAIMNGWFSGSYQVPATFDLQTVAADELLTKLKRKSEAMAPTHLIKTPSDWLAEAIL